MVSPSKAQQQQPQENRSKETDKRSHVRIQKGPRPLEKKTFYLDIKNHALSNKLEAKIKELGGKIELFLVKNISLVVTDRVDKSEQNSGDKLKWGWASGGSGGLPSLRSIEVPTPIPTPSPVAESPLANSTNLRGLALRPKSRADAMLERALTQPQQSSVDPLENAQTWGIPIWATSKLQAWLEKIYASLKEKHNLRQRGNVSREPNVKHLKSPYIKFESFFRDTRPVFLELTTWPRLNFKGEPGSCPFDINQREHKESKQVKKDIKENKNNLIYKQPDKDKDMTRRPRGGPTRTRRTELVSGYCEICRINYRDLNKHVSSDQHLNFVRNDDNFLSLDTLINAGASVEAFLNFNRSKEISKDCSLFPNVGRSLRSVVLSEDKVDSIPKSDLDGYSREINNMVQCNGARRNLDLKLNSSHNLRTRAKHESGHLLRSKGSPWHEVEKSDKFYDKFEGCTITKRAKGTIWIEEDDSHDKCIDEDSFKDIEGSDFKESAILNNVSSANIEGKDCLNTNKNSSGSQSIKFKDLNCDIKKVYELNCPQNCDEYHGSKKVTGANNRDSNDIIVPVENKIHVNGQELKEEKIHKSNKTVFIKESYPVDSLRPCSRGNKSPAACEKVHNEISKCNGHQNGSSVKVKSEKCDTEIEQLNSKTSVIAEKNMKDENFKTNKSSRRGGRTYRGRQRLSVEERLIEDNRAYYKVEVLGNKLRSSIIPTAQTSITVKDTNDATRKDDDFKKHDENASSEKPVVVRFKRVRKSELSLLSDEAETFMFGEPKRDDTTDCSDNDESSILPRDTESERDATSESLNLESSVNSEVSVIDEVIEEDSQDSLLLGRERKRRRTQAESLIKDNADYYKFQTPGSRLRYQAPFTGVKESHESASIKPQTEDVSMKIETVEPTYSAKPSPEVEKMQFSFEAIPKSEPWYQTYQRQDEGAEFWHCFSEGSTQKPFLLPYEIENFHETLLRGFGKGDNARKRGRGRGGGGVNRSPRKSPRCHASTLAIMSTLIRKREQLQSPNLSIIEEECNPNTPRTHTPKPQTGCIGKPELDEELKAIVKKIDDMLSGKHFVDLEDSFETELGALLELNSIHEQLPKGPPADLLDLLDNCQDINCLDNSSCASSECGEITCIESPLKRRKRRKNRTGWPGIKMRKKLQIKQLVDGAYESENVPVRQTEGNRLSESMDTQIMSSELQISTDNRRMKTNSMQEFQIATEEENVDHLTNQIENESPDSHPSMEFRGSSRIESLLTQNKNSIDIDKMSFTQSEPSSDSAKSDGSSIKNDASRTKSSSRESSQITKPTDDFLRNLQNCDYISKTSSQIVAMSRKQQIANSISCKVDQRSMPASEKQDSCLENEESNNLCIKDFHTMGSVSAKKQISSGFASKRRQNEEMSSEIDESDPDDENRILPCRKDPQSLTASKTQRIANNLSKKRHYKEMSSELHESDPGEENCENSCAKDASSITLFQKQTNSNAVTRKRQREETSSSNIHTSDCEDENSGKKKDANQIISSKKQQSSRKRLRKETISADPRDSDIEFAFSMSQRVSPVVSSVELKNRRSSIEFQPVVRMTKIDDQVDMDNGVLSVTVASNRRLRSSTSPRSNLHPPTKQFRNTRAQFGRWIKNS